MLILFFSLWGALFGAYVLLIAMVPTTVATPNSALLWPLGFTGVAAALVTLCVAGLLSIFF